MALARAMSGAPLGALVFALLLADALAVNVAVRDVPTLTFFWQFLGLTASPILIFAFFV
jgi:hypothetical protein